MFERRKTSILDAIFSKITGAGAGGGRISAQSLKSKLDEGEKITLVDVRTAEELRNGYIEGSIHMPLDTLEGRSDLPVEGYVVIYCAGGVRSRKALRIFEERGAADAVDLEGGIRAWINSGGNIIGKL